MTFDQTVPALVSLFADTPREVFRAHQAIEATVAPDDVRQQILQRKKKPN